MILQRSVALIGDYKPSVTAHQAIPMALELAAAHHQVSIEATWVPTANIRQADVDLASYDACRYGPNPEHNQEEQTGCKNVAEEKEGRRGYHYKQLR
ncbi:MAG TPA: hypothetical protein VKU01_25545 [Bryobacteraceae bacterium]|nr:hypothetical protein [Bryobacteraceae bacterium]